MVMALPVIDQRSNLIPVPTKKNGMNQPKNMASIFICGALPSAPWVANPTPIPAAPRNNLGLGGKSHSPESSLAISWL
jgi:hypothetical protein